jgi:hypothetical protein
MATSEDPRIRALRGVPTPLDRAQDAQRFIETGEALIAQARTIRDAAIREARGELGVVRTIDEIAQYIGAKRNVVVDALRGRRARS